MVRTLVDWTKHNEQLDESEDLMRESNPDATSNQNATPNLMSTEIVRQKSPVRRSNEIIIQDAAAREVEKFANVPKLNMIDREAQTDPTQATTFTQSEAIKESKETQIGGGS